MAAQYQQFGEWLKLRRLAAELTPLDLAKYLGIELAAYREIEAGNLGVTQGMVDRLVTLEKLKVTDRDFRGRAPLVSEADGPQRLPPPPQAPKQASTLDALIASFEAAQRGEVKPGAERPRTPLAGFLAAERERAGLSKMELARACKVMPDLFDDIEAGYMPGPAITRKLAEGLGVPHERLEEAIRQTS